MTLNLAPFGRWTLRDKTAAPVSYMLGFILRAYSSGATMTVPVSTPTATKDIWEIFQSLAPVIASIAVPLAIAWVGGAYNATIKDSENRIRYIELAIAQLRSPPTPETAALREWATELLDSQSPVRLSSAAKAQLKSSALPLVVSATAPGAVLTGTSTLTGGGASATNDATPRSSMPSSQSQ